MLGLKTVSARIRMSHADVGMTRLVRVGWPHAHAALRLCRQTCTPTFRSANGT
jgi:hypothetical protein